MNHSIENRYYFKDEILIIDDEDKEKERIKIMNFLKEEGFLVEWKVDWPGVSELLSKRLPKKLPLPDIALVDLHNPHSRVSENPDKAGIEIIKSINKWCNDNGKSPIPCIAYTGKVETPDLMKIFAAGAVSFISKTDFHDKETRYARLKALIKDINLGFPLGNRNIA